MHSLLAVVGVVVLGVVVGVVVGGVMGNVVGVVVVDVLGVVEPVDAVLGVLELPPPPQAVSTKAVDAVSK